MASEEDEDNGMTKLSQQIKCTNSEEALLDMNVEVKVTDFDLHAHSENRERNSEAVKRSRDPKKMKEEGMAFKAKLLEQENSKLRMKNFTLKKTIEDQKNLLFSLHGSDTKQSQQTQQSQESQLSLCLQTEYMDVISELTLSSLVLGDYLVIVKSDFDLVVSEEPYLALMLLLNTRTGKYIARIWNQTISTGILSSVEQLKVACIKHFEHRPCMGCPVPETEDEKTGDDFFIYPTPVPTKFSKSCLKVLSKDVCNEIVSCSECLRLNHSLNPAEFKIEATGLETDFKEECREVEEENFSVTSNQSDETTGLTQEDKIQTETASTVEESQRVLQSRQGFPKKCSLCKKVINSYWTYRKHIRCIHYGGSFTCLTCKIKASFAKDLIRHMEEEEHTDDPFVICPQCSDKYHMKDIVTHYEGCMKSFNTKSWTTASTTIVLYHYCDKCGKRFTRGSSLNTHIQVEHEKKEYECKTCKQTFKTSNKRNSHQIIEHSTDEKYNCKYCGKRFGVISKLQRHVTNNHEAPQFKCQYCGKMFKRENILEAHERMHTGEKPFPCSICGSSFTSERGLTQHMKGVHKIAKRGGQVGWVTYGKAKQGRR